MASHPPSTQLLLARRKAAFAEADNASGGCTPDGQASRSTVARHGRNDSGDSCLQIPRVTDPGVANPRISFCRNPPGTHHLRSLVWKPFQLTGPPADRRHSRRQPLAVTLHLLRDRHHVVGSSYPADVDSASVSIHRCLVDDQVSAARALYHPRNIRSEARPDTIRQDRRTPLCAADICLYCRCCDHSPASRLAIDSAVEGCLSSSPAESECSSFIALQHARARACARRLRALGVPGQAHAQTLIARSPHNIPAFGR